MKYISKNHLIALMVLVVILGIMLLLGEKFSHNTSLSINTVPPSQQATQEQINLLSNTNEPQNQMISKSFIIRPGQSRLSYTEALDLYKNNILQFNEDCQVSSSNRSFSLNNEIMIDNRASKPKTIYIGNSKMVVGPYDFGFMILRQSGADISVGCENLKNVAILNVQ